LIKELFAYVGEYKKSIFFVPIFVLFDVICELSMPLLMARIVDIGIPNQDTAFIIRTGIFMILLACAAMIFGMLNMKFSTTSSVGFAANLRNALFEKIQQFSFHNIDQFGTSSLVTRLTNDVNNLQVTLMMALRILTRAPIMLVISFFLAFRINAQLSVVLAVAIPILVVSILLIIRTAVGRFTIMQKKIDAINQVIQENLIGIRVVKSFVRAEHEISKFAFANDAFTAAAIRAINLAILNMPVMMFVLGSATIAVIWMGGRMVGLGSLGTGELISFISYIFMILISVMMMSMIIIMSARAEASGRRILEVLQAKIDIQDKSSAMVENQFSDHMEDLLKKNPNASEFPKVRKGKIEFREVNFRYSIAGSGEDVLCGINFTIESGSIVGIVGSTASGKSTLVNLIPRLYDVTSGVVLVDDMDVRDYRLYDLRAQIGTVLQTNTLFSGTILENILWGNRQATQAEVESACQLAQAHDFIMSFPDGYATLLGQGGVNISGGQKQRLCIARAMLKKPRILILDDSTSAVDLATEAKIQEAFYKDFSSITVLIISQRIRSVKGADMIVVLDDGKISGIGTHEKLMADNEIYQEINLSQQEGVLVQ